MITEVDHSMKVMVDETFGPVVGVMKVRDADEAVRLANDTRYGLSGYVFGKTAEAEAVARRLEVGAACVNDVLVNFLACDVPMGGWKDSGIGFRHGEYGIKKFVRPESLVITRLGQKREALYFPYTEKRRKLLEQDRDLLQRQGLAPQARPRPRRLTARGPGDAPPGPAARQAQRVGRGRQLAIEALGLLLEPLRDHAQPCDLGAGADAHVLGVVLAGEPHRLAHRQPGAIVAVFADQRPVRAPAGAGLVLERQPGAVAEQQRLRLATPHLHALRFLPHLVPPSLCGQSGEILAIANRTLKSLTLRLPNARCALNL